MSVLISKVGERGDHPLIPSRCGSSAGAPYRTHLEVLPCHDLPLTGYTVRKIKQGYLESVIWLECSEQSVSFETE
jgi:hypothetical protein